MARSRSSSFRQLLPCLFLYLPVFLVAGLLAGTVVTSKPNTVRPTRVVHFIIAGGAFQETSSAPTVDMVVVSYTEPSPSNCDSNNRCKKTRLSSTTTKTTPSNSTAGNHGASSKSSPKLRCFSISASTSPEMLPAAGLDEEGRPTCWLELWLGGCSSRIQCRWALPLRQLQCCKPIFSIGRCAWVPLELLSFTWSVGGEWSTSVACLCNEGHVSIRGNHAQNCSQCLGPGSLVEGFNVKSSRVNFLSPVKAIRYLRLKTPNPHRHRPVRQPRGAPAVLSECNQEDPRCLWCDHSAQRPRRRHHLCLLLGKCSIRVFRPLCTLKLSVFI
ncbi:unnamed protein product [Urochloa humidicola]